MTTTETFQTIFELIVQSDLYLKAFNLVYFYLNPNNKVKFFYGINVQLIPRLELLITFKSRLIVSWLYLEHSQVIYTEYNNLKMLHISVQLHIIMATR